jgi:phage terminase large subunit
MDVFSAVEIANPDSERLLSVWDGLIKEKPDNTRFPKDPVEFMREYLGIKLWGKQEEIVYAIWENRYVSVASCHAIGKSFTTAAILITFLHSFENSIVLSTAPTGRQVEHVLWRNVRAIWRRARKPLLGNKPLTTRYDIAEDWYAMGFKPTDQETDPLQGFHAENLLAIIDEAAGAPATIIDGMMAALTSEGAHMLMIGNPTSTSGPFYDSHHSKAAEFKTFKIAFSDTPNFKAGKTVLPYLITQQWVDEVIKRYGEKSSYVQSRVHANWVSSEDVLIDGAWIERAMNRKVEEFDPDLTPVEAGLDVARDGKDRTVLTIRRGPWVQGQWELPPAHGSETAGKVLRKLVELAPDCREIKIDEAGVGSAVYDFAVLACSDFEEYRHILVTGVNFARKPWETEKYNNQRSEAYNTVADRFRDGNIGGVLHPQSMGDLSDIKALSNARYTQPVIESKDDIRKRIGRSPDYGDSLVLAFYQPPPEEEVKMGALAFGYATQKWGKPHA